MLTCIACSKQLGGASLHDPPDDYEFAGGPGSGNATAPSTRQAVKALTAQIKDIAVKASGAYRHCKPCTGSGNSAKYSESDQPGLSSSERFYHSTYKRATPGLASSNSTPRLTGGAVMNGSSGDATPSMSGRTESEAAVPSDLMEEDGEQPEGKEWIAQVEPGVLITFVALPPGGNDLKRIRFSREIFDKWQAQRWWAENYDKVMELYNVQRFNTSSVPLPTPPRSEEDESSKEDSPVTPPLGKERLPRNFQSRHPLIGGPTSSSSDSLDHPLNHQRRGPRRHDNNILASTPKLSSISGTKTDDASMRTTSSSLGEGEDETDTEHLSVSISNASDQEREWVEEDEPGVYITIRALPGGIRELRRVRFSRERFTENHARLWWEENRARIHDQYL